MPIVDSGSSSLLRDTSNQTIGATGSGPELEDGIFEQYPPCQFTLAGLTLAFPVVRIQEEGGNRIVERERPYRDGAKLDDTGSRAKRWRIDAIFNNSLLEKDIGSINGGLPLYPDVLNFLIANFDIHETGDLVVSTIGKVRARIESYSRTEDMSERDQAVVSFVFCEDNEDSVDFRSITAPTGAGNAARLAASTELDTQSFGSWSDSLLELQESLLELEELVNGDTALDIEAAALRIEGAARRSVRTFSEAGRPGRNLFLDPANSRGNRKLTKASDLAARERARARRALPQQMIIVFRENTNIFRVAALLGQDVGDLITINPDIDPGFIPAGTFVRIFVTEALLNGSSSAA